MPEVPYHSEPPQRVSNAESVESPTPVELSYSSSTLEQAIIQDTPEAEHAPLWFKQAFRKIADAWCDPKSFENEEMYEKLGVRLFKKYVPTGGDLAMRLVWKKVFHGPSLIQRSEESLKNAEHHGRLLEQAHLAGFGVMSALIGAELALGDVKAAAANAAINGLINVYPIMLQRYNRIRLYRAINRIEQRQEPPVQ